MAIAAADVLRGYINASLQQMARQRGHDIKGKNKEALVQLLAPDLFDPDRIQRALGELARRERLLLDEVILQDGTAATEVVRGQLEREGWVAKQEKERRPYWGANRGSPWNRDSCRFEDLVARLGVLGLLFTSEPTGGGMMAELAVPGRRLFIPEGILAHLPRPQITPEAAEPPPHVLSAAPGALLRDAYVFLSAARREPLPLTARGQIQKRTLVRLEEGFQVKEGAARARSEDELGRLPFLRALLEQLGLLIQRDGALRLGEGAPGFLGQPPGERLRRLFAAWRETARWCELFRIGGLTISWRGTAGRSAPLAAVNARRRVLTEIAELPAGQWIAIDHLIDRLRRRAYEFLLPRQSTSYRFYYGYDYRYNPYSDGGNALGWTFQDIYDEAKGWERVEAGFIGVIVVDALHWLGAVDLGYDDQELLRAFRVTDLGDRLLHDRPVDLPPAATHVVVQPNFQVFAFEPTGEDVLFELDQIAERVRVDKAVEYRLTRESVYRAQRAGRDVAAIIAFLESVSAAPLPQNVRRDLEDWGARHERIVIRRNAALVHTVDEATLDTLYADPALGRLLGRRVAPTAALVAYANLGPLYERLLATGRLPALSEGGAPDGAPQFTLDAEGRIAFRHRLPSIFLRRDLRPFTEEGLDGAARLTPESLRRAAQEGLTAERILETLTRAHAGPLPEEVPALVRRWAKDWGRGALVEAALLQVETAGILDELLADPELKPFLRRFPGAETLALVRPAAVGRVRAALEARGMALSDSLLR